MVVECAREEVVVDGPMPSRKQQWKRTWRKEVDEPRQVVLAAWMKVLRNHHLASTSGTQLSQVITDDVEETQMQILRGVVDDKSTSTLRVRALDFNKFMAWAVVQGESTGEGITEELACKYCVHLCESLSAATSASRLRESMAFVRHVFGWQVEDAAITNRRVIGQGMPAMKWCKPFKRPFLSDLREQLGRDWVLRDYCSTRPQGATSTPDGARICLLTT
eukprot:3509951-Amphidinium_carterae.1